MPEVKVDQNYMISEMANRIAQLTVENIALHSALAVYQAAEAVEEDDSKEEQLPLE